MKKSQVKDQIHRMGYAPSWKSEIHKDTLADRVMAHLTSSIPLSVVQRAHKEIEDENRQAEKKASERSPKTPAEFNAQH